VAPDMVIVEVLEVVFEGVGEVNDIVAVVVDVSVVIVVLKVNESALALLTLP
jgi:hypothetical protein